jgi:crotonobetainyl-CoA:carnitine CoA-transferase CaiB-like acyl-CoA transferase
MGLTPGTAEKWDLSYETCREINPRLIYCHTSQMGSGGPLSRAPGYGIMGGAFCGFSHLLGEPSGPPLLLYNNVTDYTGPYYSVIAIVGALFHREETGKGTCIDGSQVESGMTFIGPLFLDYAANKRDTARSGNRDPYFAPHGVYPCQEEGWIAIAVRNDEEWSSLCRALGNPPWAEDQKFSTQMDRKKHEEEINRLLADKTIQYSNTQLMDLLQNNGVPAGVVATAEMVTQDPQLIERGVFYTAEHPVLGEYYPRKFLGCTFSKTPPRLLKPSPCIGEDNEFVYKTLLEFSDREIADLTAEGVITTEEDLGSKTGWLGG